MTDLKTLGQVPILGTTRDPETARLKVTGESLELAISKGQITGHSMVYVNAYANEITQTTKLIWPFDSQYVISDTPSSLWLTSTEALDNQNVLIEWLDGDHNKNTSLITLNGQTPVEFAAGVGFRVNKCRTLSPTPTTGDVYISRVNAHAGGIPTNTDNIVSAYTSETQTSRLAFYSVPAGFTLFGDVGYFSSPKSRDNDFYWNVQNPSINIPKTETNVVMVYQNTVEINFAGTPIPEKTDAWFTAKTEAGSGRTSCRVVGILVDNNYL